MPLPPSSSPDPNGTPWPPLSLAGMYSKMIEWAAWYSGDPDRIINAYNAATSANNGQVPWWRFWSRARQGRDAASQRALIHVPIASDLAATSGALLFGSPAIFRIRDARQQLDEDDEGDEPTADKPKAAPPQTPAQKAEARMLEIIEEGGFNERLLQAAESAAAIGGVYIYPVWNTDLVGVPLLGVAQADMAVPTFRHGILTSVVFHKVVRDENFKLWRLLESHDVEGTGSQRRCVVTSALYAGSVDRLGTQLDVGATEDIAGYPIVPRVEMPFPELDVEYIPNMLPNRIWRSESLGVSDYSGSESMLDALDETYASWIRDIRLAKARILVPREYLRPSSVDGQTPTFDIDQEIYVGMDMEPGISSDARAMMAHQFEIRYEAHQATAENLVARIVSNAGYTPGTIGQTEKGTGTGTALRISEHKTLLTLRRKGSWWKRALSNVLFHMMVIDSTEFDGQPTPDPDFRPTVTMTDSLIDNPLELAQTALALSTASASSIETRVRIVHPDWSELEIDAEVRRVKSELAAAKPAPLTVIAAPHPPAAGGSAPGAFGAPHTDPASTGNLPVTPGPKGPVPTNAPPASPPQAKNVS